jgi:hypothetical protein
MARKFGGVGSNPPIPYGKNFGRISTPPRSLRKDLIREYGDKLGFDDME